MIGTLIARLRRRRLVFMVFLGLIFASIYLCYTRAYTSMPLAMQGFQPAPSPEEASRQHKAADAAQKPLAPISYGTTARPPFKDLVNIIADLPAKYIPHEEEAGAEGAEGKKRRLIIIGDLHGQRAEFEAILKKVKFNEELDHIILTGDLINKGPDSPGVVSLAMQLNASAVRGNHEDRVLLAHAAMNTHLAPGTTGESGSLARGLLDRVFGSKDTNPARKDDTTTPTPRQAAETDTLEQNPFSHGDQVDRETAASLTTAQIDWLAALPVILRISPVPTLHHLVVVHAGLVPGLPLEKQDPWAAMNMRSLRYPMDDLRRDRIREELTRVAEAKARGRPVEIRNEDVEAELRRQKNGKGWVPAPGDSVAVPVDDRGGEMWADGWNRFQRGLAAGKRMTVVYGHDAKTGLNIAKGETWTYGLDSGCVYGRQLSALVFEIGKKGMEHKLVQIGCKKGTRD